VRRLVGLTLLVLWALPAQAPEDPTAVWNEFASATRAWTETVTASPEGTVSAAEYREWHEVKQRWKRVERVFDGYYGRGR
jgi:hypothetical protein